MRKPAAQSVYHYHHEHVRGTSVNFAAIRALRPRSNADAVYRKICLSGTDRPLRPKIAAFRKASLKRRGWVYGFSHIPSWAFERPPGDVRIVVFRDPIDCALSLYATTLADLVEGRLTPYTSLLTDVEISKAGFLAFLSALPLEKRCHQLYMWSKSGNPREACEAASRVEHVLAGIERVPEVLSEALGLDVSLPIVGQKKVNVERVRHALRADGLAMSDAREVLSDEYDLVHGIIPVSEQFRLVYSQDVNALDPDSAGQHEYLTVSE